MADDGLESSHWDDAISSNPSGFNSKITDELSNTLSQQNLHDDDDDEVEEEEEQSKWDDGSVGKHDDKEDEENDEGELKEDKESEESYSKKDQENVKTTPSKAKESRDTSGLLSSLTVDADKGFIAESFKSPSKDEALFRDNKKSALNFGSDDKDEEDSTPQPAHLLSPTKLANRRKNVYKAPRFRRNGMKTSVPKVEIDPSTEQNKNPDVLGPLGITDETESTTEDSETPADRLLRATEAPLFEINRTPLSPLKTVRTGSLPSTSGTISSDPKDITSSSASDIPQDPQQQLEQAKILEKKKEEAKPKINLDIVVGDPIKVGDLTSAHIVYSVRTTTDSELLRSPQTVVSRRYRDFRWLYRQLQSTHPGRIIPPPPEKQAVGRFNDEFIEARRLALERMLVKISKNPNLQTDPDFIMFLQSERFSSEAREREKAAGTFSTFTTHEKDNDASLNSSASGGFLSSIGGAFSFAPKVTEPDEYFKEKKSYVEALDQQFKVFLKNLETIVIQRHDLSTVTEEFSLILGTLADLEVSKNSTELFQEFSTTQLRIKESLDRLSLQDMLTLGSTLDEYQRVISSIKTTFTQRDRVLVQWATAESELKKKQAAFDKFFKHNRTHTEKIDALKIELNSLEQKHSSIRAKFDDISSTIREELATFEVEKIHDFRNSIEIFLESSIESQKEAVELWETFYDVNLASTTTTA